MVAHFAPPFDIKVVELDRYGGKELTSLTSYVVPQIGSYVYLPPPAHARYTVRNVTYDFEKQVIGVDVERTS